MAEVYEKFNWSIIKRRYLAGESAYQIAKTPDTPSRQYIARRAKRDGWDALRATQLPAEAPSSEPVPRHRLGKNTPQNRALVLEILAQGGTFRVASARVGMNERTLRQWREADSDFSAQCDAAQAAFTSKHLSNIDQAAVRDWKASKFLVEHHPMTRGDFQPRRAGADLNLQVGFLWARDDHNLPPGVILDASVSAQRSHASE